MANDLSSVYQELGIDKSKLGCIMLDVAPVPSVSLVPMGKEDLYFSDKPETDYVDGEVGAHTAHITLLFGLLGTHPEWDKHVDAALEGWTPPESVEISHIGNFPGDGYACIVAHIRPTPELTDAHNRLKALPHIETFPDYKPHITLAYVHSGPTVVGWASSTEDKWIRSLQNPLSGQKINVLGLNYGGHEA